MNIQSLTQAQIMSVYTGKAGACCCGCKDKHQYNSQHVVAASKDRGYEVKPDEVNDAQVTKVLRTLQANEELVQDEGGHVCAEIGNRIFIAYLVQS